MVRKFERRTGNYVGGDELNKMDDTVMLTVPEPTGGVLETSEPFNLTQPNAWSKLVQIDYDAIKRGTFKYSDASSTWVVEQLDAWGMTAGRMRSLSRAQSMKLGNKLLRAAQEHKTRRDAELLERILSSGKRDPSVAGARLERGPVMSAIEMSGRGGVPRELMERHAQGERGALHARLRLWALGPLTLERPQASSLHHMIEYDSRTSPGELGEMLRQDECQIFLVENNWGAAVPEMDGEWRVPFELICWEFRISGVRVLAFTDEGSSPGIMWMVYGRDSHWVVDDYRYELGCSSLPRGVAAWATDVHEFRRVARMCYDTIRASCIMLDARVASTARVAAPVKLSERRVREGRAPLRDHYVVRLLNSERRAHVVARRGASAHAGDARAPQRGHWRKGTWVHYDDPDSGQQQYPNDGGFVVSKTWRRWHFAGDPRNIISKEYRL